MGSPVTSAQFRKLVEGKVQRVVRNTYDQIPSVKDKIYDVITSDRAYEDFYGITGIQDIPRFNGQLSYLSMFPGWYTKIEPKEFAGGIQFERKLLDDERYGVLTDRASLLSESVRRVQVKYEVRPFAYAATAAFDFTTSEEGVALASNSHATKSGVSTSSGFDNLGTSPITNTSIATTRLTMKMFRDDIGERFNMPDDLVLIVPQTQEEAAWTFVKTQSGYQTAASDKNFHADRYEIMALPYLDDYDTASWGMASKSLMKKYMKWIERIKPDPNTTWDFDTFMLKLSIYLRFANGVTGWRHLYWHQVT